MSTNWTNCDTPCICSIEKETIPDHLAFFFAIFSCKSPGPFTPSTRNTLDRTRWTSSLASTVTKSKSSWHYFLGEEVLKKNRYIISKYRMSMNWTSDTLCISSSERGTHPRPPRFLFCPGRASRDSNERARPPASLIKFLRRTFEALRASQSRENGSRISRRVNSPSLVICSFFLCKKKVEESADMIYKKDNTCRNKVTFKHVTNNKVGVILLKQYNIFLIKQDQIWKKKISSLEKLPEKFSALRFPQVHSWVYLIFFNSIFFFLFCLIVSNLSQIPESKGMHSAHFFLF